jgi:DNA-binding response OmpR family regulator
MFPRLRRKQRVLLLDDDPSMQRLVSRLLEREGYRVDVFLTGRDAMRAIDSQKYDVLLLDLMMPHEGGMTVIRELREKNPDLLLRSLVLTASPASVISSVKGDVAGVVTKPFQSLDLINAVRKLDKNSK